MNKLHSPRTSARILTRSIAALIAVAAFSPGNASAATGDWNIDNNTTTGWGTAGNWLGGTIPNAQDDVANFLFNITAARTINLDGSRTLGTMNVGDPTTPSAYTFNANGQGGALIFDTSAGNANLTFTAASGAAANVFNVPLVLNDTLEINALNTGQQVFNGNITGLGGLLVDSNGTHGAGTTSLVGQVLLSGLNTFSGGLTVTEARVNASAPASLGTGAITINDGGQVLLVGGGFVANNFTINGFGWNEPTIIQAGALRTEAASTFTGSITLAGNSRLAGQAAAVNLVNGVIGETGGARNLEINRLQTGSAANSVWVFNNTNTYTGTTTVYSGTLRIGDGSLTGLGAGGTTGSLGATSGLQFGNGTLEFRRNDNVTITTAFTQLTGTIGGVAVTGGNFIHSGLGTLTLNNGDSAYLGTTTANGLNGKLVFGTGAAFNFGAAGVSAGAVTLSNGADIEFNTSSDVTLNGAITGATQSYLIQSGSGILTLGGTANNPNARAIVNSGTLVLQKTGTSDSLAALGTGNELALIINGGTVRMGAAGTGNKQLFINNDVQINGGSLDLNGKSDNFDTLTGGGGNITNGAAATTSTLILGTNNSTVSVFGSTAYFANYGGVIEDGAGAGVMAITKNGTGLQIFSGANTYTGTTTIAAGVLSITNSLALGGAVAVNSTGTLSGTGSVGNVTMAIGSSVRPGANHWDTATGTLTAASLTVNGGDIRMNLGASNDLVSVTGAANFTAASTITPIFTAPPVAGANITLVNSGGLTLGVTPTLTLPATTRSTFGIVQNGNALELAISGASAEALAWTAQSVAVWNANTTANFNYGGAATTFFNLDSVAFGDQPYGRVVTLAAGLTPSAVSVNNSTGNDYVFQTGTLVGGMGLTKTGNGLLALNTANTFGGNVSITGGILRAGNAAALGDANGQTIVSGGGTLDVNGQNLGAEVVRISGTGVGGLGALVNNGAQQTQALRFITLTGDATVGGIGRFDIRANGGGEALDLAGFTLTKVGTNLFYAVGAHVTDGNINVQGGQFGLALAGQLFQGTGTLTLNPGTRGIFFQTTGANITRNIVVNNGEFDTEATSAAVNSNVSLTGNLSVVNAAGTLTLNGTLSESGGARSLTKGIGGSGTFNANNTVTLNGNNTLTGGITVNNGTVNLGGTNTFTGPITLNGYRSGAGMANAALQVLSTLQAPATLGTPSGIALNAGTLRLNLASNYTLPAVTMTNPILANNVINFNGITQGATLTVNSTLGTTDAFNILNLEQGTTNFASGANVTVNTLNVGLAALATGNVGTLNIQPGSTVTARTFYIGEGGTGRTGFVNQSGGTVNVTGVDGRIDEGSLQIGRFDGVAGTYNLSGGTLNVPNATTSIAVININSAFNVSGGTANLYRLLVDGRTATPPIGGGFNLSGGEVAIGAGGLGATTYAPNSNINLSGGTLSASTHTIWASGMNFVNNNPTLDTRGNLVTGAGALFGPGGFTKAGSGTLVLTSAASNIAGTVNVNTGNLYLAGVLGSTASTSQVNVNNGAALILDGSGGGGIVGGAVNVNNGGLLLGFGNGTTSGRAGTLITAAGGEVRPGIGAGTLAAGVANIGGGAFRFDLNPTNTATGGGVNDLVAVAGAANFSGGTITPSFSAAPTSGNTYTLFTSTGLTGLPTVDPAALVSRLTYAVAASGNDVTLNVTGTTKSLTWTGSTNNNWNVNTTQNWSDGAPDVFMQADSVTFDGTAPGVVNLVGSIQPAAITVNSAADYTFSGGSLDAGALTKSGSGTLTLATANAIGSATIADGTVAFVNRGLGSGPIVMTGGGVRWQPGNTEDVSFRTVMTAATNASFDTNGNNVVFGAGLGNASTGNLVKEGAGTLILTGNSTYTGTTTVNGGVLQMGAGGTTGAVSAAGAVTVNASGTLSVYRLATAVNNVPFTFANSVSGAGTLDLKGDGSGGTSATSINPFDYVLSGNNSGLTGAVIVTNARAQLDSVNDIGTAAVTINPGGQLIMGNATTYNNALTMSGIGWAESAAPGNLGALRFGGGATWAGAVTLAGNTRIHAHATADTGFITGAIGGAGNLTKTATPGTGAAGGSITLGGATSNTYVGTTIVDSGKLLLGKTGGAIAIPGAIQMGGGNTSQPDLRMSQSNQFATGVVMTAANTFNNWTRFDLLGTRQTLSGISDSLGGLVIQNGGIGVGTAVNATLTVDNAVDYSIASHVRDFDNVNSGGKLNLIKTGIGALTINQVPGIGSRVSYTGTTTIDNGTLKLVNLTTTLPAGGVAYNSPTTVNANGIFELNSTQPFATRMVLGTGASLAGTGTLNKTGAGFGYVSGVINFAGTINVLEGTFGNDGNAANWAGSTADLNVSTGAIFDSRADSTTINSFNGTGTVTNSVGNAVLANAQVPVFDTFTVGVAGGSGVFSGPITDGGNGNGEQRGGLAFTKAGAGTQTLTGTNSYSGTTTINDGVLRIGAGGATGTLGLGPVVTNASLVINRAGTIAAHNAISGTGTLTKEGAGTLVLTNNNSYAGATTISGGTVQLGAATTLPVSAAIWLDATDGGTINTTLGAVNSWTNKGTLGALGDATALAGQEPVFIASEAAMNNQPVIHFDAGTPNGIAPFDRLTNGIDWTAGNVTTMYVGRLSGGAGGANQRLLAGVNNNWLLGTHGAADNIGGGSERAFFNGWLYQGAGFDTNSRIYTGTTTGAGESAFYVNGTIRSTLAGTQGPAGLSLGGGYNVTGTTEFSDGDIGELLVFSSVLSADDRRAVEAYLNRKWKGAGTNVLPSTTAVSLTASGATLDINGVTQAVGSIAGVAGTSITLGDGNLTTGGDGSSTSFDGVISGAGTVTKTGGGIWTLSGANTNTGDVNVAGGTLLVSGSLTGSLVHVQSGGTLGGAGTIAGAVDIAAGGFLSPGNSPGTLTTGSLDITGAVTGVGSASLLFEVGVGGDKLVISTGEALSIGSGVLEFDDFVFSVMPTLVPGTYTLFDSSLPIVGTLGTSLSGSFGFDFTGTLAFANGGNDIVLAVVPEPGSAALLLGGLALLAGRRRRNL